MSSHLAQIRSLSETGSIRKAVKHRVEADAQARDFEHLPDPPRSLFHWKSSKSTAAAHEQAFAELYSTELEETQAVLAAEIRAQAETRRQSIAAKQLTEEVAIQRSAGKALAKKCGQAAVEAMHDGQTLVAYSSRLIRFIEQTESDGVIADSYVQMVRRIALSAMSEMECKACSSESLFE